jgi:Holliday junction resolvase
MAAESKLQARIVSDLEERGYYVVKVTLCNKPGHPDLTAYKDRVSNFIECKAPGKVATKLQEYRHEQLRKQGFNVWVVSNWEEYKQTKL